jgi:plasmid rolling circle replication initiator protein Rep
MSAAEKLGLAPGEIEADNWATPLEQARERGILEREALIDRLRREGADDLARKLTTCGETLPLVCVNCGSKHPVEVACKRRWCPACAWRVQKDRMARFSEAGAAMKWPLFITLTMRNTGDPQCIRTIREAWGRMRRRKLMAQRIAGGIATIEITNQGNGWHPHLHVLADCQWLALHTPEPSFGDSEGVKRQKYDHARLELSALWGSVIKQETAIVSALRKEPGAALAYTLKYAVKGSDLIDSPDPIAPLLRVLNKSRLVSAFGNLHNLEPELIEEERPKCKCGKCGAEGAFLPDWIIDKLERDSYDRRLGNR